MDRLPLPKTGVMVERTAVLPDLAVVVPGAAVLAADFMRMSLHANADADKHPV